MADEGGGGGGYNDILFLVFVFGVILFAWFTTGAYKSADLGGIFLSPPSPLGSGEAYGPTIGPGGFSWGGVSGGWGENEEYVEGELSDIDPANLSPYRGQVVLALAYGTTATNPQSEYVTIRASTGNTGSVLITGWQIVSAVTQRSAVIGQGVSVFTPNQIDAQGPISLRAGDEAIIVTGRSPVGTSFRDNLCTGYLTQYQNLTPEPSFTCPLPTTEADAVFGYSMENSCYSFLQSISQCRITLSFPDDVSPTCRQFVENRLTYQGCVSAHRHEPGFLTNTWRIYLNQSAELWKSEREVVTLLDQSGKIVDVLSY